jgi:hypothetical protein
MRPAADIEEGKRSNEAPCPALTSAARRWSNSLVESPRRAFSTLRTAVATSSTIISSSVADLLTIRTGLQWYRQPTPEDHAAERRAVGTFDDMLGGVDSRRAVADGRGDSRKDPGTRDSRGPSASDQKSGADEDLRMGG